MKPFDSEGIVNLPVCRIVFDDRVEFYDFEMLASYLDMDANWPIHMLRDYLEGFKESFSVPGKPFSWDYVSRETKRRETTKRGNFQ